MMKIKNDLISRKEAEKCCLDGWNKDYKEILEDIRKLPSAEKTAEWIIDDYIDENGYCSNCNFYMLSEYVKGMKYCPNCGARMKKESEEDNED